MPPDSDPPTDNEPHPFMTADEVADDIVTRAISGHATLEMQRHCLTVSAAEMRTGLAKVIDIATGLERSAA